MSQILVSGLINIETTLQVDGFPIPYFPVRYPFNRVSSTVSGVGFNIAKALTVLGDQVSFLSMIGDDSPAIMVEVEIEKVGIPEKYILRSLSATPQSVILYEPGGRRQIHVDLKEIQETIYPPDIFQEAMEIADLVVLCNINFSRPFLQSARQADKIIATDVHVISQLEGTYDDDFMAYADILFMSDEHLPTTPERWAQEVINKYNNRILVIGLGKNGALLTVPEDRFMERIPAVHTPRIVNTIGAGDALFSAFLHVYAKTMDPYLAIRKSMVFASKKIGVASAADGFLSSQQLDQEHRHIFQEESR